MRDRGDVDADPASPITHDGDTRYATQGSWLEGVGGPRLRRGVEESCYGGGGVAVVGYSVFLF